MTARLIMKLRVAAATLTTPDVLLLSLVHPTRPDLPAWTAGAHVDLRLPDRLVRQYSLCGDPADRSRYQIAIKREPDGRGGSVWAHTTFEVGAVAHISAPRNNFPLANEAREHALVGGGIGVTPLKAMAHELVRHDAAFHLHLCARSATGAPLLRELRDLCGPRLTTWFSAEGRRFDASVLGPPRDGTHVYACGPGRLLAAVNEGLVAAGWPAERVHAEVFSPLVDESFTPEPFDVRLASSGRTVHVPADRSILDVLREAGMNLPSSCGLGVCGACVCGYRDGTVLHRDVVIPLADRQDRIAICVSRARVMVTLDL